MSFFADTLFVALLLKGGYDRAMAQHPKHRLTVCIPPCVLLIFNLVEAENKPIQHRVPQLCAIEAPSSQKSLSLITLWSPLGGGCATFEFPPLVKASSSQSVPFTSLRLPPAGASCKF